MAPSNGDRDDKSNRNDETNPFVAFRHHIDSQLEGISNTFASRPHRSPFSSSTTDTVISAGAERDRELQLRLLEEHHHRRQNPWRRFEANYERATNPERKPSESRGRLDPVNPSEKEEDQREWRGAGSWGPFSWSGRARGSFNVSSIRGNEQTTGNGGNASREDVEKWNGFWQELREAQQEGRPVDSACPAFSGAMGAAGHDYEEEDRIDPAYTPASLAQDPHLRGRKPWADAFSDLQRDVHHEEEQMRRLHHQISKHFSFEFPLSPFSGMPPMPSMILRHFGLQDSDESEEDQHASPHRGLAAFHIADPHPQEPLSKLQEPVCPAGGDTCPRNDGMAELEASVKSLTNDENAPQHLKDLASFVKADLRAKWEAENHERLKSGAPLAKPPSIAYDEWHPEPLIWRELRRLQQVQKDKEQGGPDTELDMYEAFLGRDDRSAPNVDETQVQQPAGQRPNSWEYFSKKLSAQECGGGPSVLDCLKTQERKVGQDGWVTTTTTLKRRFKDGTVEEDRNVDATPSNTLVSDWQSQQQQEQLKLAQAREKARVNSLRKFSQTENSTEKSKEQEGENKSWSSWFWSR